MTDLKIEVKLYNLSITNKGIKSTLTTYRAVATKGLRLPRDNIKFAFITEPDITPNSIKL